MKCLVVIPARGGSKRIPHKNIALLMGRPLLLYAIDCARAAGLLGATVVSTEDARISATAIEAGARVAVRPPALATDTASTEAVLLDALDQRIAAGEGEVDWIVTLPPTSPLRSPATLTRFVAELDAAAADVDCIMSVTENRSDFWRYDAEGRFGRLFPDAPRRQQDRAPLYEENSAIYMTRVAALRETGSVLGRKVVGLPISAFEALDINTPADLELAEALLARRAS